MTPNPMPDLIVVLPGIMGSRLVDRNGRELWGVSAGMVLRSIVRMARNFEAIRLPDGIGDDHPGDGVTAQDLLPVPHMIGKLLGADGYESLIKWLRTWFNVWEPTPDRAGNLIPFPYDWRLSNRFNGKRIELTIVPELERWREASGNADAKLIFICHSMGGLVARWFTEVLGGRELTRRLITIGTPYRGSIEALALLSNGFNPGFGPVRFPLTEIIRTLPSAHQLLPTYKCMDAGAGLKRIIEFAIPDVNTGMVMDALKFHADILTAATANTTESYRKHALKGIAQPTAQSATIGPNGVERVTSYNGRDFGGDGTVPRQSSHPPEWVSDDLAGAFVQQHATLQSDGNLHRQLFSILTADQMEVYADAANLFGLDIPEVIPAGETLGVTATSTTGDSTLPLRVEVFEERGADVDTKLMRNHGGGIYDATFEELPPGLLRVVVSSATPGHLLDAITGMTIVWDEAKLGRP